MAWARKEEVRDARARELKEERAARAARRGLSAAQASALASAEAEEQAMEDWREDRYEEAGLATFMEGSAWVEFEGFSNNLFLGAIEYVDMGDEARELAYESGLLDL